VRQITVQRLTRAGLRRIGPTVIDLATAEGLSAHAASVAMRMKESAAPKPLAKAGPRR
jgi:histidinol dehydrogenase